MHTDKTNIQLLETAVSSYNSAEVNNLHLSICDEDVWKTLILLCIYREAQPAKKGLQFILISIFFLIKMKIKPEATEQY